VLAGCATTKPPTADEKAAAGLGPVVALVEKATVASLTDAAKALAETAPDAAGSAPGAATLAACGARLFGFLYPELPSPFAQAPGAPTAAAAPESSPFLQKVLPVVGGLAGGGSLDDTHAADLQGDIAAADALNATSVLPPWLQALVEKSRGKHAAEKPLLEEALRRDPGFYPAARELVLRVIADGGAASQLARLETLAGLMPNAAQRFELLARARLAAGQPQAAADAAAQGLLAAPDESSFTLLRAQALDEMGDWYGAMRILDAALRLRPDLIDAILLKARVLYADEKNSVEAIQVLSDAEERFPREAALPELRGSILLDLGKTEAATDELNRALSLQPGRVTTVSLLLRAAVDAGSWDDARALIAKIPEADRTSDDLRRAWKAAEAQGDHDAAVAFARALGAQEPGAESITLEARSLLAAGRASDAAAAADRGLAIAVTPQQKSSLRAIRALAGASDPLTELRQALLDDPDNLDALAAISDVLAAQGDARKAWEYAKRASQLAPNDAELARKAADLAAKAGTGQ
jgi:tetratricopeptide (TPR) repeat protein